MTPQSGRSCGQQAIGDLLGQWEARNRGQRERKLLVVESHFGKNFWLGLDTTLSDVSGFIPVFLKPKGQLWAASTSVFNPKDGQTVEKPNSFLEKIASGLPGGSMGNHTVLWGCAPQ